MRLTTRQTGVISYAGLEESALWEAARHAFGRPEKELPGRFAAFLPVFPAELIVNMSYVGSRKNASPLGFSVSSDEYHRKLSEELPQLYAGDNRRRLFREDGTFRGGIVTVDTVWAMMFPQYAPFQGEKLMIHLIGGGHQAVAVPESIFPRSGGILYGAEMQLGVTARCAHYTAWLLERLRMGEPYDPVRMEEAYLQQTGLSTLLIRQKTLARMMQDMSIVRDLQGKGEAAPHLYTEESTLVKDVKQYAPYRCACDLFEETPITRHLTKLMQLYYEGDAFQSDLWLPYEDAAQYLNRKRMALDVRALCDGYQIAPAPDPDTRGGAYPNRVRVAIVRDRTLPLLTAECINNPAYGSGMSPMGLINRRVCVKNSAEMISQGKLTLETHAITCENTRIPEAELLRMREMAEVQEHKGRLIDAMYRRESALSQMRLGTLAYERARDILDAKVDRLSSLVKSAPRHQRSGYDADIEYLQKKALFREGAADEAFSPDPLREKCIETGFAMRSSMHRHAMTDLYHKPARESPKQPETKKQRSSGGQWFEQMDFFSALPQNPESE